jgi:hypothetical protein
VREKNTGSLRPVRFAYQPPASSTFLSEQTSNQPAVLFSQNKSAPAISHQPAYQPPASSTFLSEQTSNQPAVLFSQNKSAPAISQTNRLHSEKKVLLSGG